MSFARALFTVSGLTIVSRVSGFIRDTLTAMLLGGGPIADAAFAAQRLPNLFRSLFAEGAFSAAFVPLYTTEQRKHGFKSAQQFAGQALALLMTILIPFSLLIMICMPLVIRLLAPGFDPGSDQYALTVRFSMITFPYLALVSITALQGGVLNAQGKFAAAAAAPISLNIVIAALLVVAYIYHFHPGYTLSWALLIAGVVQMLWLVVSCYRAHVSIPLTAPAMNRTTKLLFKRIGPGALGAGAAQINMLLSTILASTLPSGAISSLSYADRLNQLPQGIVGVALATTLLPLLTHHVESGAEDNVRHYISRALEFCLMLGLPAALGFVIVAKPIVQTLFEHGAFDPEITLKTSQALAAYAFGIPAFLFIKVFSAGFFARHDTATPVKMALIAMVVNIVFALLLLHSLEHIGIAIGSSVALWVNAGLLFYKLRRQKRAFVDDKWLYRLPRLLFCSLIMSLITLGLTVETQGLFAGSHTGREILGLTVIIGGSGLSYALMLQVTGAMRWKEMLAILRRGSKGSQQFNVEP